MAITLTQTNHNENAAGALSIAVTLNGIAAGSLVLVAGTGGNVGVNFTTLLDDLSVAGTLIENVNQAAINQRYGGWYFANYGGGNRTFTLSFDASATFRGIIVTEWAGAATTTPLDLHTQATGNTTTPDTGSAGTPAQSGDLVWGYAGAAANQPAIGGGFTNIFQDTVNLCENEYLVQGSPAVVQATWAAFGAADQWGALVASFKASAAGIDRDVLIRFGQITTTLGSGLITAAFASNVVGGALGGGAYFLRRRQLDAMTTMDDI